MFPRRFSYVGLGLNGRTLQKFGLVPITLAPRRIWTFSMPPHISKLWMVTKHPFGRPRGCKEGSLKKSRLSSFFMEDCVGWDRLCWVKVSLWSTSPNLWNFGLAYKRCNLMKMWMMTLVVNGDYTAKWAYKVRFLGSPTSICRKRCGKFGRTQTEVLCLASHSK
jgi:hypothetical protein